MGVCGSGKEYHLMSDIETFYTWPRTTPPPPPSLTIVPSEKTIDENCIQRQPSDKYTNTHKHTDMFNYAHETIHMQKNNANTHKQKINKCTKTCFRGIPNNLRHWHFAIFSH